MRARRLMRVGLLATLMVCASGCQRHVVQATPPAASAASASAPFATPPVLPGTPDVATLVAKVKPGVVNITTL